MEATRPVLLLNQSILLDIVVLMHQTNPYTSDLTPGRNMTTPHPATGPTEKTTGIMIIMVITDHNTAPQMVVAGARQMAGEQRGIRAEDCSRSQQELRT